MKIETQNSDKPQNPQLNIGAVITSIYFFLVKWMVLKPIVKLSYIINGKMLGDVKWYQRAWDGKVKWKCLNTTAYKLSKYVMFAKK